MVLQDFAIRLSCSDPTLTTLDLRGNGISDTGATLVADALRHNTTLTELRLYRNSISNAGASALAEALSFNNVLTELDLRGNRTGVAGAEALAEMLKKNSPLRELSLCWNQIGADGAAAMAESLEQNTVLRKIDLSGNGIGDAGTRKLGAVLGKRNNTLAALALGGNGITDLGAEALAEALRHNTTLKELGLYGNRITDGGASAVAEALKHNDALEELSIYGNEIGDAGAEAMAKALTENGALKGLELDHNRIGDIGAKALARALSHNAALKELELESNNISHSTRRFVQMALANSGRMPPGSKGHEDRHCDEGFKSRVMLIPYQELQLHPGVIGASSSKIAHRAQWRGEEVVALTVCSGEAELEETTFERLGRCRRLTQLLGKSWDLEHRPVLITQFAPMGSLERVLGDLDKEGKTVNNPVLTRCAMQICEGMQQVAEEGIVHRRLALHNVLVFGFDSDRPKAVSVKVADYGLPRKLGGERFGKEAMQVRWMAPEVINKRQWSEKSDLWAFGVLMWELWSAAEIPYALVLDNHEVAWLIRNGRQLSQPTGCPDNVFALMRRCWEYEPESRPTFQEVCAELLELYVELVG